MGSIVANETPSNTRPNNDNDYEVSQLSISQDHDSGIWNARFHYDKFYNLGSYKTHGMAVYAFELLMSRISVEECIDAKTVDDLVQHIRITASGTSTKINLTKNKKGDTEKPKKKKVKHSK